MALPPPASSDSSHPRRPSFVFGKSQSKQRNEAPTLPSFTFRPSSTIQAQPHTHTHTHTQAPPPPPLPQGCCCPLTRRPMKNPVFAFTTTIAFTITTSTSTSNNNNNNTHTYTHTYEKKALEEWIRRGHFMEPVTGEVVQAWRLVPDISLRKAMEDFVNRGLLLPSTYEEEEGEGETKEEEEEEEEGEGEEEKKKEMGEELPSRLRRRLPLTEEEKERRMIERALDAFEATLPIFHRLQMSASLPGADVNLLRAALHQIFGGGEESKMTTTVATVGGAPLSSPLILASSIDAAASTFAAPSSSSSFSSSSTTTTTTTSTHTTAPITTTTSTDMDPLILSASHPLAIASGLRCLFPISTSRVLLLILSTWTSHTHIHVTLEALAALARLLHSFEGKGKEGEEECNTIMGPEGGGAEAVLTILRTYSKKLYTHTHTHTPIMRAMVYDVLDRGLFLLVLTVTTSTAAATAAAVGAVGGNFGCMGDVQGSLSSFFSPSSPQAKMALLLVEQDLDGFLVKLLQEWCEKKEQEEDGDEEANNENAMDIDESDKAPRLAPSFVTHSFSLLHHLLVACPAPAMPSFHTRIHPREYDEYYSDEDYEEHREWDEYDEIDEEVQAVLARITRLAEVLTPTHPPTHTHTHPERRTIALARRLCQQQAVIMIVKTLKLYPKDAHLHLVGWGVCGLLGTQIRPYQSLFPSSVEGESESDFATLASVCEALFEALETFDGMWGRGTDGGEGEVEGLHMRIRANVMAVAGVVMMHHGEEEVPELMVDEGLVELMYEVVEEVLQGGGSAGVEEEKEEGEEEGRIKVNLSVPSPERAVVMNGMQALRMLAEKSEEARDHLGDLGACALVIDLIQAIGPCGDERAATKELQVEAWMFVADLAKDNEENLARLKRCGVTGRLREAEEASDDGHFLDVVLTVVRRRLTVRGSGFAGGFLSR